MESVNHGVVQRALFTFVIILTVFLFINIQAADAEEGQNPGSESANVDEGYIIAEVNGRSISTGELLKQYNLYFIISRFSFSYSEGLTVNSYLDRFIAELVLLEKAEQMGIKVSKDEVDKALAEYIKFYNLTDEILLRWLTSKTLSMDDARLYFKNYLVLKKLYLKVAGPLNIPEKDIKNYYDEHILRYVRPAKIRASQILICHTESLGCESKLSKARAKELAEKIRVEATPENFSELARRYSYDSTGRSGGALGVIDQGMATPAFDKAAFSIKKGEISDVVETDYGFHLIYVSDRADALDTSLADAAPPIKNTLEIKKIYPALIKYSEQLKKDADIKKYAPGEKKESAAKVEEKAVKSFSTYKPTGKNALKNSKGRPIVILFTRVGCHFCEWVEETYEEVVSEYVNKGLIEAHHYDFTSKDDLLTPEKENEIPAEFIEYYEHENPNSSTPCFQFGGIYYRLGTGYYEQDDLYAEEMEMRQVIDALLE